MSFCVLDCSAMAGWCFVDEADSASDQLLAKIVKQGAIVPAHWHLEVVNMLLQAVKRKRITSAEIAETLSDISELPIEVDTATHHHAFGSTSLYGINEQLTSYDAAYLELAMRRGLPLATKDEALRKACKRLGVKVA